eukprot:scaffold78046_cov60-Phaeocystis_antarctica.AAC.2
MRHTCQAIGRVRDRHMRWAGRSGGGVCHSSLHGRHALDAAAAMSVKHVSAVRHAGRWKPAAAAAAAADAAAAVHV